jgi:hypothetical protein
VKGNRKCGVEKKRRGKWGEALRYANVSVKYIYPEQELHKGKAQVATKNEIGDKM